PKGNVIYDMGQNMVGYVQLTVDGKKGQKIILKHAEVLDKDKNFFTLNLRSAKATTEFILKGGKEILKPKFTFQGFRYVKVEGLKNPKLENITGIVVHTEMKQTGTFECSDDLINQLQSNIIWSQKGNFLDVPTDCPQRDERLGWTGDIQAFSPTAAYNMDVAGFLTKWMRDLSADQYETGSVPHVIPDVLRGSNWKGATGSTGWGDAAVVVPWTLYQAYGDKRILEQQYESMKAWVDYETSQADEDGIWRFGTGFEGVLMHFGDWLSYSSEAADFPGATTDKDLIATAYYANSSSTLSKIAAIIGNKGDEKKYKTQYEKIKKAFKTEFITPSGRLSSNTQTAYVLALSFGLVPDELIERSAIYLAKDVAHLKHLTTGFLGTPLLMQTLCNTGYEDLAFMLINRKIFPSWLYPVTVGATTIWERWDSQRPDGSFNGDTMNSFNHYAYGAVGSWLYNYVVGIRIDESMPGYKKIIIKPTIGGGLTFAASTHESMYGTISSSWKIEDGKVITEVEIPANTTAVVYIPNLKNEYEKHEIGSGKYTFIR
ncbi:MAG: family 78 glycoside hydrolase catalytic domain, partial [Bacteroidales bacterium]|nr:family 78 glycoside hydrolase catalytic domain [Bacteroidales bacterium]